jgi:putative chitinase
MSDFIPSKEQLAQLIPGNTNIDKWYAAMTKVLPQYDINSKQRVAAFIAQCGHESGGFKFLKENLNYKAESLMRVWPKYFPDLATANKYAHNQDMIANRAYANRMGNGDESSGDGARFCGRGLIQLTGRANQQAFATSINRDIKDMPEFLSTFEGAVQSACWFWQEHKLNQYADTDDILTMTKRINGGTLGLEERTKNYNNALKILGA